MSDLFVLPRAEVQDSSGGVEAGAKLEFFITSTSTNLDTYSDDALTTANANPVIADSAGRFGAIFLRDEDYKVVLSDSDDVQIWSADPVRGGVDNLADDTIRSSLATTGSANAFALTVNRTITAYANGDVFIAKANFTITGAATLNVTGGQSGASALGAKTIKKRHDQDVASGDIENGQWCVWKYDGTNMQLLSGVATGGYVDPITTRGDLIRGDASGNVERLAVGTADEVLTSDGTDAAWGAVPTATDTVVGGAETATQDEQETGGAVDKMVTPGRQQFHPSAAKVWVKWEQTGANSILASYNMTSVTDGGAAGDTDHLFATDFSGTEYALMAVAEDNRSVWPTITMIAGGVTTLSRTSDNATATDSNHNMMVIFGDQ